MQDLAVVGQPVKRIDALDKVTGSTRYGMDLDWPGLRWVAAVRSPLPHATVRRIDTSAAAQLPGVEMVITARDVRGRPRYGLIRQDQPVLVAEGDVARHVGDPVALVVASSREVALEAAALVQGDYAERRVIGTPEAALAPAAARLHAECASNIVGEYHFSQGDVAQGFSQADIVVEHTYHLPRQEHAYLETEGGIATLDGLDRVTVCAPCQRPVWVRDAIAATLGLPASKVRVVTTPAGGAFGGKVGISVHLHLALAALLTGGPVKMVWTREESMLVHPKRHPVRIRCRLGATDAGMLTAVEADILSDAGAYASHSAVVLHATCSYFPGPYHIPHIKVDGRAVYTNNPVSGAFRGYGQPQAVTALECEMDALAWKLGMDPVQLRLKNVHRQGMSPGCPRIVLDGPVTLPETLEEALEAAGALPKPSDPGKRVGRGISCAMPIFDVCSLAAADMKGVGATIEVLPDGSAILRTGACEIGMGITTALAQMAAEELGIDMSAISVIFGDTDSVPDAGPTVASRQTYCSGNAVKLAAQEVRMRLLDRAAEELGVPPDRLSLREGRVVVEDEPSLRVAELARLCHLEGINLVGSGWFAADYPPDGHTYITALVDVQVDEATGETQVLRCINVHDIGRAINPVTVRGQLIGGGLQGLGYALMEEMEVREGRMATPTLSEYLIPTALDIPRQFVAKTIENPYPTGPYGAKGVGEHATDATPAAVVNAVSNAIGVRLTRLPLTPERIWRALEEARPAGSADAEAGQL